MRSFRPLALAAALSVLVTGCATVRQATPGEASPTDGPGSATEQPSPTTGGESRKPSGSAEIPEDELLAFELTDVRTGEHFTLAQLAPDGPILLEPMAVWCSNCRAQMHEVTQAHQAAEFQSVSLDVDLSETAQELAAYADPEGWDWRFAMAGPDLYRLLQQRFGDAATYPPATPLIVIERDGSVRPLEFGVGTRSPDQLMAELQAD
jgi:thiol-disulfide isomerase/thioredoxin